MWSEDIREQIDVAMIPVHGQIVIDAIKRSRCQCNKCNFCKNPERFYYVLEMYVQYKRARHIYKEIVDSDFWWASRDEIRTGMPNNMIHLVGINPTNRFYQIILACDCDEGKLYRNMIYFMDEYYRMKPCSDCVRRFNPTGKTNFMGQTLAVRQKLPKDRLKGEPLI